MIIDDVRRLRRCLLHRGTVAIVAVAMIIDIVRRCRCRPFVAVAMIIDIARRRRRRPLHRGTDHRRRRPRLRCCPSRRHHRRCHRHILTLHCLIVT